MNERLTQLELAAANASRLRPDDALMGSISRAAVRIGRSVVQRVAAGELEERAAEEVLDDLIVEMSLPVSPKADADA